MKNLERFIRIMLVFVSVMLSLGSCSEEGGGDSLPYEGSWSYSYSETAGDTTITVSLTLTENTFEQLTQMTTGDGMPVFSPEACAQGNFSATETATDAYSFTATITRDGYDGTTWTELNPSEEAKGTIVLTEGESVMTFTIMRNEEPTTIVFERND